MKPELIAPAPPRTTKNPRVKWIKWMSAAGLTLIVAGTLLWRASVPVLTIGPSVRKAAHSGGRFHRVLFPTDFTPEAQGAAPYAVSMAQENQTRLLLHVMRVPALKGTDKAGQDSVANVMHQLYELVPQAAELWCRTEATVRFGNPSERILEVAVQHDADLIVLGVRDATGRLGAATHLERTTAHRVVAHAACPVLTVRGRTIPERNSRFPVSPHSLLACPLCPKAAVTQVTARCGTCYILFPAFRL
jgi:nucleotide-binding universal stress UspA family protein